MGTKLTDETAITSGFAATDVIPFVDITEGTAGNRKITVANLAVAFIAVATAITSGFHATQDHLWYDDNGVGKKITVPYLANAIGGLTTTALTGANWAVDDTFLIYDLDATALKAVTTVEMLNGVCSATINATALTGANTHATQDFFLISDNGVAKSITSTELCNIYPAVITTALAGSGMHATQDKVPIFDNGVAKHALVTELLIGAVALSVDINTGYHATEDVIPYIDNGVASKITVPNLMEALFILTATELSGANIVGADQLLLGDGTAGAAVPKYITVTSLISAAALLGYTLADIPEYADQAAAATALTGTGRLFRFATTGALGVTIT